MDGPIEKSHSGFDICECSLHGCCVAEVPTTVAWGKMGMPRYRRVAYPGQRQCQIGYIYVYIPYLRDFDIKILYVLYFQHVYVL